MALHSAIPQVEVQMRSTHHNSGFRRPRFKLATSSLLALVWLFSGITSRADINVVSSGGANNITAPFGRHYIPAAPTGVTTIYAEADDTRATPPFPPPASTTVNYATAASPATAGPVSAPGTSFAPGANAQLSWGFQPHVFP